MQTTDKVVINIEESRKIGVEVSPPDVNRGEYRFVPDTPKSIVYGLGAIKGLGEGPVDALVEARHLGGEFTDLFDLCERVDSKRVNKRAIEAMIGSGALDNLVSVEGEINVDPIDYRRGMLDVNYEDAIKAAEQQARNAEMGHGDLFGGELLGPADDGQRYNHFDRLKPLSLKDRLVREKETLGLYLTGHPLDAFDDDLGHLTSLRISHLREGRDQTIVGLVVEMRTMKNKRGDTIAFMTLDDRTGRTEISVSADLFEKHYEKLKTDAVLVIKGNASNDDFTGGLRMRASEITDIAAARERSVKRLRVNLKGCHLGKAFDVELAQLLTPFRGTSGDGCPVAVGYQREDASGEIVLGDEWRVQPSDDLIQNLRDHYGAECVSLDY